MCLDCLICALTVLDVPLLSCMCLDCLGCVLTILYVSCSCDREYSVESKVTDTKVRALPYPISPQNQTPDPELKPLTLEDGGGLLAAARLELPFFSSLLLLSLVLSDTHTVYEPCIRSRLRTALFSLRTVGERGGNIYTDWCTFTWRSGPESALNCRINDRVRILPSLYTTELIYDRATELIHDRA